MAIPESKHFLFPAAYVGVHGCIWSIVGMSWVKRLHLITTALILEKKTKEIHSQKKKKKRKKYTASREEKEMKMKASQRKQFLSRVLKREYL